MEPDAAVLEPSAPGARAPAVRLATVPTPVRPPLLGPATPLEDDALDDTMPLLLM